MSGQVRLLIDGSKVGFGHQLVMVSVAYKRRSILVAWTWVKYKHGDSTWGWQYVLRQKGSHLVSRDGKEWQNLQSLVRKAGESAWLSATNLPYHNTCIKAYSYRMWIEEMFGDLKRHGFDLEGRHLLDTDKLLRLTLAVVLLYVWLLCYGHVLRSKA